MVLAMVWDNWLEKKLFCLLWIYGSNLPEDTRPIVGPLSRVIEVDIDDEW